MFKERMLGYYPTAIQSIKEFQSIIDSEYPEIESVNSEYDRLVYDAYMLTMGEDRLAEWEQLLNIRPVEGSTVSARRDTIIARVRAQNKLNTSTINAIVNAFTGGEAESWVEDSVLYVVITPPPEHKLYNLDSVIQELSRKIPAHLGLSVFRSVNSWGDVKSNNENWKEVRACYANWNDVLYDNRRKPNQLDVTAFDNFYLG